MRKPVSPMEISWNPKKYLPYCYLFIFTMYFVNQYFIISTNWVHSPCPQSINIFHTDRLWNFAFLMQIIFCIIEENNYANQFVGIYVKATTKFSYFAFSHGSCKSTFQSIVHFFLLNPSLSKRWVLRNSTLISITSMYSRSFNVLQTD